MFPFYNLLTNSEKNLLESGAKVKKYEKGDMIHSHGDTCIGMFCVKRGLVSLSIVSDEGKKVTVLQIEEGGICVLGAACIFKQISFDVHLEAADFCVLEILSAPTMASLMESNTAVENAIYKLAAKSMSGIILSVQKFLFFSIGKRIAIYLLDERQRCAGNLIFATHEQIAHHTGSVREVVTRELNKMAKAGLITLGRKTIEIIDAEALENYK